MMQLVIGCFIGGAVVFVVMACCNVSASADRYASTLKDVDQHGRVIVKPESVQCQK